VFLICGLAFKVSAAPFHMWTPDVYEGAPTPVVGFFAGAPKLAAMVLLARALSEGFGSAIGQWQQVIVLVALMSIFVGAFAGLAQRNLKRLWAYSSIANVGYALLGLAAGGDVRQVRPVHRRKVLEPLGRGDAATVDPVIGGDLHARDSRCVAGHLRPPCGQLLRLRLPVRSHRH